MDTLETSEQTEVEAHNTNGTSNPDDEHQNGHISEAEIDQIKKIVQPITDQESKLEEKATTEEEEEIINTESIEISQILADNAADQSDAHMAKDSNSIEFTYTSLDEVKSDSDENKKNDLIQSESNDKIELANNKFESIDSQLNTNLEQSPPPPPSVVTTTISNNETNDEASLKKLSFDSVIERVKSNRVTNKEVCSYVLNLLVSGEFDLEKNFVIQNFKSILYMIQVIKCASSSLKVSFINFFLLSLVK